MNPTYSLDHMDHLKYMHKFEKKTFSLDNMSVTSSYLRNVSIFDNFTDAEKRDLLDLIKLMIKDDLFFDRCVGALMGMAYGDFIGAPVEFLEASNKSNIVTINSTKPYIHYKKMCGVASLKLGQWTDDTSMGLCLADSLIIKKSFSGSDQRIRYWNWWNCGYNNAFRFDKQQPSVGLGGNISKSLKLIKNEIPEPIYIPKISSDSPNDLCNDSGNGSIMRLAPIPIMYHKCSQEIIRKYAILSSVTTHPGDDASEACAFMSHIINSAINRLYDYIDTVYLTTMDKILGSICRNYKTSKLTPIQYFLDSVIAKYETTNPYLKKLIVANEKDTSTEYCWNWRSSTIDIVKTIENRGDKYNGYPVNRSYFGSYCFDGLAIALHALYNTTNFDDAILKTVNMLGDADSTGSICGQMAGAFYGFSKINSVFYELLRRWDNDEIIMRAFFLYKLSEKVTD